MKLTKYSAITIALLAFTSGAFASLVVVGNANNPVKDLSKNELKAIYLGKPTNVSLTPLDQPSSSSQYKIFYKDLFNWDDSDIGNYWTSQVFSGGGNPPASVNNDHAALVAIAQNPEAIAYVDSKAIENYTGYRVLYQFGGASTPKVTTQKIQIEKPAALKKPATKTTTKPAVKAKPKHNTIIFHAPKKSPEMQIEQTIAAAQPKAATTQKSQIIISNQPKPTASNHKALEKFKASLSSVNQTLLSEGNTAYFGSPVLDSNNPNAVILKVNPIWWKQSSAVKNSTLQTVYQLWQEALNNSAKAVIKLKNPAGKWQSYNGHSSL